MVIDGVVGRRLRLEGSGGGGLVWVAGGLESSAVVSGSAYCVTALSPGSALVRGAAPGCGGSAGAAVV